MRVHYLISQLFFLSLFVSVSYCKADVRTFQVVGSADCADCKKNNFETNQAFAGLHVTIDCKLKNGQMLRVGTTEVNEKGYFKVLLPKDIVHENGQELKEQCYAQLHNAAALPCTAPGSIEASKIVFKSQHTFTPTKTLRFSAILCTSKFLWNHPWFQNHPWFHTPPTTVPSPMQPLPPTTVKPPVKPLLPPTVQPPVKPLPPAKKPPTQPLPPAKTPKTPCPVYKLPPHPYFKHPKYSLPLPPPIHGHSYKLPPHPYFKHPKYSLPLPPPIHGHP